MYPLKPRLRVYHIEDSTVIRSLVATELSGFPGIELVGYWDRVEEVAARVCTASPDVLILDLGLAKGNGLEVLQQLGALRPPVVVMLTNQSDSVSRDRCFEAGADFFFDKSTEISDFVALMKTLALSANAG